VRSWCEASRTKRFWCSSRCARRCHHGVGGLHQRQQLARRVVAGQRRQVGPARARSSRVAELAHRPRGRCTTQHHHEAITASSSGLLPQRVQQDLARQRVAQLQRLGHLDGGHALAGWAGHRLQQHGHAHRLAAELVVVEAHQGGVDGGLAGSVRAPGGRSSKPETISPSKPLTR
jgi:hypothetical protein